MRKMMTWVMAATLIISGLGVFTACSSSSDDGEKGNQGVGSPDHI